MKTSEAKAWLELNGQHVEERSLRTKCPICQGGQSGELSFVIFRDSGQLVGSCYRGTCGATIRTGSRKFIAAPKKGKPFNRRVYTGNTKGCNKTMQRYFKNKFQISGDTMLKEGVRYDPDRKRMVFPVFDYKGVGFGYNLKETKLTTDGMAKWVTYFDRETSRLHYPKSFKKMNTYPHIVLVEDIISAIRVAQLAPVVALQGTSLNWEQVSELIDQTDKIILALDPDGGGIKAATQAKKRFGMMFKGGMDFRILLDDPKRYPSDELLRKDLGL